MEKDDRNSRGATHNSLRSSLKENLWPSTSRSTSKMLTRTLERARIVKKYVMENRIMVNAPFLIKFARLPLDRGTDSGTTGPEQGGNEKSQARIPNTFITKVDRETTDDR